MPTRSALPGERIDTSSPSIRIVPASAGASPKSASASSESAGADDPVEPDDLAGANGERHRPEHAAPLKLLTSIRTGPGVTGVCGNSAERSRPTMARTSAASVHSLVGRARDLPTVAKDRHAVGQREDLVELVRDVDDGGPHCREPAHDGEQLSYLVHVSDEVGSSRIKTRGDADTPLTISTSWRSAMLR